MRVVSLHLQILQVLNLQECKHADTAIRMGRADFVCGVPWLSSKPEREIFNEQQFACVYAVGPSGGRPLRFGWARQLQDRMQQLQLGSWKELTIHQIVWTVGDMLAVRLLQDTIALVEKRRLYGDWFDVTADLGKQAILVAADKQVVPTFSHTEMLEKVRRLRKGRIDAAVRGA